MQLIRYLPAAPLNRHVECFWWSQRDAPSSGCEHTLPSGTTQLLFAAPIARCIIAFKVRPAQAGKKSSRPPPAAATT